MSTIVDIADAVVTTLNGASLSQAFTAERGYLVPRDLTDLDGLKVTVIPVSLLQFARDLGPRQTFDWGVGIIVQQRVALAGVDALMILVQEIISLFATQTLGNLRSRAIGVENQPIYDPAMLDTHGLFQSQIIVTFRETLS